MSWGSKFWANEHLRYAIKTLDYQISGFGCGVKGRLQLALIMKKDLEIEGFRWQARILGCHIHRFQKDHKKEIVGLRRILHE